MHEVQMSLRIDLAAALRFTSGPGTLGSMVITYSPSMMVMYCRKTLVRYCPVL